MTLTLLTQAGRSLSLGLAFSGFHAKEWSGGEHRKTLARRVIWQRPWPQPLSSSNTSHFRCELLPSSWVGPDPWLPKVPILAASNGKSQLGRPGGSPESQGSGLVRSSPFSVLFPRCIFLSAHLPLAIPS